MDLKTVLPEDSRVWNPPYEDEFPVVVSRETGDGGKAGAFTEVARRTGRED